MNTEKLTNKIYSNLATLSNTAIQTTFNILSQTTFIKTTVCLYSNFYILLCQQHRSLLRDSLVSWVTAQTGRTFD